MNKVTTELPVQIAAALPGWRALYADETGWYVEAIACWAILEEANWHPNRSEIDEDTPPLGYRYRWVSGMATSPGDKLVDSPEQSLNFVGYLGPDEDVPPVEEGIAMWNDIERGRRERAERLRVAGK